MKCLAALFFCFLMCFFHTKQAQGETLTLDGEAQFTYARTLYESGDYISAMVEFKRFIHFFPDDARVSEARYLTGLCWMNGGRYPEALQVFQEISGKTPEDPFAVDAGFMTARCHEKTGNPLLGAVELQNLIRGSKDESVKERARYALALLYLDTGSWNMARQTLESMDHGSRSLYPVDQVLAGLDKTPDIPRKNPVVSGALALVPGAGYLYCERPRDALVSFIINGGLIYSAIRSFRRDDYALGGVVSFVGFGFYAGSIHGSVTAARKYNRARDRRFIEDLKRALPVTVGLIPLSRKGPGIFLSLEY